jgi:hypothetical protein
MPLFLVPRTGAWQTEEELAATADCLPSVTAAQAGDVRWIRSYIVEEADGSLGAYCVYQADGPEALRRHGEAIGLPTDAIKPVTATLVNAPDPEPA